MNPMRKAMVINKYHHDGCVPSDAVNIMRGSEFGNPYAIGDRWGSREKVIARYKAYLWRKMKDDPEFMKRVGELHGRRLCCCCDPLPCHGHVLADAAEWVANGGKIE